MTSNHYWVQWVQHDGATDNMGNLNQNQHVQRMVASANLGFFSAEVELYTAASVSARAGAPFALD